MAKSAHQLVYPAKDLEKTKKLFSALLGTAPYADAPFYVGFHTEDGEVGLDPHGASNGPIAYWETEDIAATIGELTGAGWQVVSDPKDVGGGLLVAQLTDGGGNTVGFRQAGR